MILLRHSKLWESERARGKGKPFITFKLSDPTFFGVKAAHVYKSGQHWNWVWWDIAAHDHRSSSVGFKSPEHAGLNMLVQLALDADTVSERRRKLWENHQ